MMQQFRTVADAHKHILGYKSTATIKNACVAAQEHGKVVTNDDDAFLYWDDGKMRVRKHGKRAWEIDITSPQIVEWQKRGKEAALEEAKRQQKEEKAKADAGAAEKLQGVEEERDELKQEVEDLKNEIAQLKADHAAEIERINSAHANEVNQIKAACDVKLAQLEARLYKEFNEKLTARATPASAPKAAPVPNAVKATIADGEPSGGKRAKNLTTEQKEAIALEWDAYMEENPNAPLSDFAKLWLSAHNSDRSFRTIERAVKAMRNI